MVSALASTALLQAKTVVDNLHGLPTKFLGSTNPAVTDLAGLQVGSVGLNSHAAERAGLEFKSATSKGISHSRYIPGSKKIHFKFLARDGKLIGAQVIGEEDVKERINALTLIIREGINLETILRTERCYTPPLALLNDPMFAALEKLV
jgi:NADH oxidase (H2O2-forming)